MATEVSLDQDCSSFSVRGGGFGASQCVFRRGGGPWFQAKGLLGVRRNILGGVGASWFVFRRGGGPWFQAKALLGVRKNVLNVGVLFVIHRHRSEGGWFSGIEEVYGFKFGPSMFTKVIWRSRV